jgi:uncharacterized protein (TIGR02246 family)
LVCVWGPRQTLGGSQDPPAPRPDAAPAVDRANPHAEDLAALRELNEAFVRDFNNGDAPGLASRFTEDARIIDEDGEITEGRAAIEARFAETFKADPGARLSLTTESIRFLTEAVAIEEGRATLKVAEGEEGDPEESRYSVIYVKRDGRWFQANERDHAVKSVESPREHLQQLSWMIGEWMSEDNEVVVRSSCRWAEKENFLLRSFTIQAEGRSVQSGVERIGWDPLTKQFKSWVFDSDGGFGEGFLYRAGDGGWIQKASGVNSEGQIVSASRHITIESKDRFLWTIVDRTISGHAQPGGTFVMVRQPPQPMNP